MVTNGLMTRPIPRTSLLVHCRWVHRCRNASVKTKLIDGGSVAWWCGDCVSEVES